jgi:hypothetical protein
MINLYYSLRVYCRRPHFRGARFCRLPHALRACHLPPPSRASFHPRRFLRRRGCPALESRPRILHPRIKQRLVPRRPRIEQPQLPSMARFLRRPTPPRLPRIPPADPPPSNQAAAATFHPRIEQPRLPSMALLPSTASPAAAPLESRPRATSHPGRPPLAYYGRGDASTGNTPRGSSHMTRPRRPRYTTRSAVAPPPSLTARLRTCEADREEK